MRAPKAQPRKKINLALQGGGAHGAFTWGVLDHLLQDGSPTSGAAPAPTATCHAFSAR